MRRTASLGLVALVAVVVAVVATTGARRGRTEARGSDARGNVVGAWLAVAGRVPLRSRSTARRERLRSGVRDARARPAAARVPLRIRRV